MRNFSPSTNHWRMAAFTETVTLKQLHGIVYLIQICAILLLAVTGLLLCPIVIYRYKHAPNRLVSSFDGTAQLSGLVTENNQGNSSQKPGGDYKIQSEFDQVPIIRRFVVAVLGLLGGFFLSLRGWNLFDKDRRLLGASLIGLGWLLGALGLTLLILTDYPSTWRWIL